MNNQILTDEVYRQTNSIEIERTRLRLVFLISAFSSIDDRVIGFDMIAAFSVAESKIIVALLSKTAPNDYQVDNFSFVKCFE